jgi:hypothetical protein
MNYELTLLEEWEGVGDWDLQMETTRIRQAFMAMALSHKKDIFLRRYFRVHHEGLKALEKKLRGSRKKEIKELIAVVEELLIYLTDHFGRYLEPGKGEGLDPDDPDIDAQKVITTFSLAELGVIIRLFIETGAFRVRNRRALTRFMSRNVVIRTKQVPETFSEEHLYNAIHSPSESAMDRLQVMINQMLVELNKLRRESRKKG